MTAANGALDKSAIKRIGAVCREGKMIKIKPAKIDVFVEAATGKLFLLDIKCICNKGFFTEKIENLPFRFAKRLDPIYIFSCESAVSVEWKGVAGGG